MSSSETVSSVSHTQSADCATERPCPRPTSGTDGTSGEYGCALQEVTGGRRVVWMSESIESAKAVMRRPWRIGPGRVDEGFPACQWTACTHSFDLSLSQQNECGITQITQDRACARLSQSGRCLTPGRHATLESRSGKAVGISSVR